MLNTEDWEQIKRLQEEVEQADQISLKLNWDMLQSRKPGQKDDFVGRRDGRIVGFLGLYDFASKVEVCGMVAPHYRRQGLFRSLLAEALPPERAARYKEILLNIPAGSVSGKGYANRFGFDVTFTEYQMRFHSARIDLSAPVPKPVTLRKASSSDLVELNRLDMQGFGLAEEEASLLNVESLAANGSEAPDSILYIIEHESQNVGKVRIHYGPKESWIYGFVIAPEYQGQGFGRSVLMTIVRQEHAKGKQIFLEVAVENDRALHLYQSSGFESINAQDYYQISPGLYK